MTSFNSPNHPDLETLLAFSEARLSDSQAESVSRHLESCARCRLEIKCFERFDTLGEDPLEDPEVQWDRAELELERAWRQEIQPAIEVSSEARRRTWRQTTWLVPAAVAAMAALIFLVPAHSPEVFSPAASSRILRGAERDTTTQITLISPSGELETPPILFSWKIEMECDHFNLEVFTADLKTVLSITEIKESSWTPTPKAAALLKSETIYLWSVRGYDELQPISESVNNWFRFSKID